MLGASCSSDSQCPSGWCATDNPAGECTADCMTDAECGVTGACLAESDGYGTCYLRCSSNAGCRSRYVCDAAGVCLPQ